MSKILPFLLLLTLLAACVPQQATGEGVLPLEACRLPGGEAAECGTLTVYLDPAAASGPSLELKIAVVPADTNLPEPDPLFLLAGGPGQAAIETFGPYLGLLDDIRAERDLVLVDQRGTGGSGGLNCPELEDAPPDLSLEEFYVLMAGCRVELAAQTDLTKYTTELAMQDLDAVRAALGYERINLYGASYGTRAALTYMRRYPERVRSAVLDAVAGPELVLNFQAPRDGQRALELFFERCQSDTACQAQFPELEAEFRTLLDRLEGGLRLPIAHPNTGEPLDLDLTQDDFTGLVFSLLYSSDMVSLLPLLIHHASFTGDLAPLVAQGMVASDLGLYHGMFYSVTCSEDAPLIDLEQASRLQRDTIFPLMAETLLTVCAEWPQAEVPFDFRAPVRTDIPTLLLSGSADPVTPPYYAEAVADDLPNSQHVILEGQGHGQLFSGCTAQVVTQFLDRGRLEGLETDCLEELQPFPFFVDFTGPQP